MSEENGKTYIELIKSNHNEGLEGREGGEIKTQEEEDEEERKRRRKRRRKKRCYICCGSFCGILIMIAMVLIILGFTIFRPKNPKIGVESITLEELKGDIGIDLPPTIHLNVTLGLLVSVRNPNPVGFRYTESTCHLFYRDLEVGVIPIPPGAIGPGKSIRFVSHLDLLADRMLLGDTDHLIRDFLAGSLPFSTTTRVSGRVNFLNLFRPRVKAMSRCDITVSVSDRSTQYVCDYTMKL